MKAPRTVHGGYGVRGRRLDRADLSIGGEKNVSN